jgi:hypothetical protein
MSTNHDEALAWLAFVEGKNDEALSLLRSVADKQDAEGKGEVELPAKCRLSHPARCFRFALLPSGTPCHARRSHDRPALRINHAAFGVTSEP